jgi:hypothetical protein
MVGEPNDRPSALLEEMLRQEPGAIRRADGNGLETAPEASDADSFCSFR